MKLKENLQLRKVGRQYMVVDTCSGNVNLSKVFTLNETAAGLWQRMEGGEYSVEELTDWMCGEYEVDRETAREDIEKQLEVWKREGLVG